MSDKEKLYTDAPIRSVSHPKGLCRECTKTLFDISECTNKYSDYFVDGYQVIHSCAGFEDYRNLVPQPEQQPEDKA